MSSFFPFRQYHLNSSTTSTTTDVHMDMYCGLPVDFSSFNLPRNGDFTQVSFVSVDDILIYREMGAFTKEVMWQPVWLTAE